MNPALGSGRPGALVREFSQFLKYRDLLFLLVQKDLKVKYKGTVLGLFWSLLNPLLMMAVYTAVFTVLVRFTVPRYPIFILSALLPWNAFAAALGSSVLSLIANGNLIKRVHFPIEFLPLSSVLSSLVHMLLGFAVLVIFAIVFGQPLGAPLLALPVVVALQLIMTAGIALALAAATVYFRDLEHLVTVGLTVWFFVTPIIFPASALGSKAWVLRLNPFTWLASSYQAIWHDNAWPAAADLGGLLVVSLLCLAGGLALFHRLRPRIAEEI